MSQAQRFLRGQPKKGQLRLVSAPEFDGGFPAVLYALAVYLLPETIMATGTVFMKHRMQAIRLPAELRLPEGVKRVSVRARGNERIIAPLAETWDSFFIDGPVVSPDFMDERTVQQQTEREAW